jgi:hypothetical protein
MPLASSYIARSQTTGKYHFAMSANASECHSGGSSRKSPRLRAATEIEIGKASEESFCKKCFPNGKPVAKDDNPQVQLPY